MISQLKQHSTLIKVCSLVSLISLIFLLGYRLGIMEELRTERGGSLWNQSDKRIATVNECEDFVMRSSFSRNPASDFEVTDYQRALEKNHLEEKSGRMGAFFHGTELGFALVQLTTLVKFGPGEDLEGKTVFEALKLLESTPEETFREIQSSLKRMGMEWVAERQLLFQLVGRLDLDPSVKMDYFIEQLNRAVDAPDVNQGKLNASVVLLALMQLDVDLSQINEAFKQVLVAHRSYDFRVYLISLYESKYPEEGRKIWNDLN